MEAVESQNESTTVINCDKDNTMESEVSKDNQTNEMTPDKTEPVESATDEEHQENSDASSATKDISKEDTAELEETNIEVTDGKSDQNEEKVLNGEELKDNNDQSIATGSVDNSVDVTEEKNAPISINEQTMNKKAKKKDKSSAEEKKLVDLLVHVFDGLETPEKKMEALAKKYIQLAADMKTTESKLEDVDGKHRDVKREKEQLQHDFSKVNMAKSKLESLCRELQKQNKIIKEEIQKRSDEEDRKRRELSQKFQSTINDITTQMGENHKRNQQLKQDNTDLAQKLKGLVEQYEVREQHIEKVLKAKQLELQLCEAKLHQQTNILQEERQNHLKEKRALLTESLEQEKKVETLVKQEAELKGQLSLYTEKFVEFQSTLTKSNDVFATFKKEMDKMTKTIRKLEKESNTWKTRYENTNVSLVQMVEERTQKDNDIMVQKGKVDKLEKLCRALQAERRKLKKELEEHEKPDASSDKMFDEYGKTLVDVTNENQKEEMQSEKENGICEPNEMDSNGKESTRDERTDVKEIPSNDSAVNCQNESKMELNENNEVESKFN